MAHGEFVQDPIHGAVLQGGFSRERGGNLRDHDGCKAGPGTMSTTHYDGDYGTTPANLISPAAGVGVRGGSSGGGGLSSPGQGQSASTTPVRGGSIGGGGLSSQGLRSVREPLGGRGRLR